MHKVFFLIFISFPALASAKDTTFTFITSDKVKLHIRVVGTGEPCLFVHGGPGSTSYYFEAMPAADLLQDKLQMIYFDQRGSGRSSSPADNNYSPDRFVKDMEEIRTLLKIKKWHVMGHSFAGILLTEYAMRFPGPILSLLYINATLNMRASMLSHLNFGIRELGLQNDRSLTDASVPVEQRAWKVHAKLAEKGIWYKLMYRNAYEKKFNDSVTAMIGEANYDFGNKVWEIPGFSDDYSTKTSKILLPVLIITGNKDHAIGVDHYKSFQFPNKKVVHYIGGHAPFQEEPQWFSEKVLKFVKRQ